MKNQNAVALGRLGGLKKSKPKTAAVKINLEAARKKRWPEKIKK